jgi:carbamoyl-phosphate synthase large subunit
MKNINILVDGVGGDVAQGVIKALSRSILKLRIYKICAYHNSSWLHMDNDSYIAPLSVSDDYVPYLKNIIRKKNIDVFIPCVDSEIVKISHHKDDIEKSTGCIVAVDIFDKVEICDDKYKTFTFLKNHKLATPMTIIPSSYEAITSIVSQCGFPLIAKNRRGQGSKDIQLIHTAAQAREFIGMETHVLQEYIHGGEEEYTAGIYLGEDKAVKGVCILQRELKGGATYRARRVINKSWEAQLSKIVKIIDMKYINIQFRLDGDNILPFEFNGRFSGTTGIISKVFNAPDYYIREIFLGEEINEVYNDEEFYVMRYYDEIYASPAEVNSLINRSKTI